MKNKGFTLIETMVVIILMSLVLTALWRVYSATRKNAHEIMENNTLNDQMDRTLTKITDDLREANGVDKDFPPVYEPAEIANLKTSDENNQLKFMKVNYDFSQSPSSLSGDEVNYTTNQIRYYVEKEDETKPDSKWLLNREMTPCDKNKEPIESESTVYNILSGIEECIFYRVKDPDATRTGNIYIKLKMGRTDDSKYSSETIVSVKERGAMP